ncbi:cytochrome P450 oxidoreductase [Thozetella sp. PMI_491]|nr:cytochrome P450 oxidoreductase [Thozetella sp. PMI_491]
MFTEILPKILSVFRLLCSWQVFFSIVLLSLLRNRYACGISHIPGPLSMSLTQFVRVFHVWTGRNYDYDLSLHRRYGNVVRIGPRLVSVASVDDLPVIYGVTTKFYKSSFYDPSTPYDEHGMLPDPFVLKDRAMHTRMKRNSANAYAMSALVQLEPYFDQTAATLFASLDTIAGTPGNVVDFGDYMHRFAMDAVFMLTFGKTMQLVEKGDKDRVLSAFDIIMPYMSLTRVAAFKVGQIPWIHKYLAGNELMAKVILGEMTFESGLLDIASSQVAAFKKDLKQRPEDEPCTFVQRLLLNQQTNPISLTDREIITHALGNITAGSDTTSTTLRTIFYYCLKNRDTYRQLAEEARANCTYPATFAQAKDLPYLNAVIKEALRIHPPMAIMLGRTVPKGGAYIGGHFLPEGTEVGANAWVLHRDPVIFPDGDTWRPERWLTTDDDHLSRMNKAFFAFGGGPHTCSGRHISTMEITKLVPSLLIKYDFHLAYPEREWQFKSTMLATQKGVHVTLTPRAF